MRIKELYFCTSCSYVKALAPIDADKPVKTDCSFCKTFTVFVKVKNATQTLEQQEGSEGEYQEGSSVGQVAETGNSDSVKRSKKSKEEEIALTRIIVSTLCALEDHFRKKLFRLIQD